MVNQAVLFMNDLFYRYYVAVYVFVAVAVCWLVLPSSLDHNEKDLVTQSLVSGLHNYFGHFAGFSECNIRAADLYSVPAKDHLGLYQSDTFCHDRKHLLQAMSDGGRIGFDAPYQSRGRSPSTFRETGMLTYLGCSYRWFDVEEMCFILERFDGLIFIGDEYLEMIYSGFNILLRQDLALGALNLETMDHNLQNECRCNNQYVKPDCRQHYLLESSSQEEHAGSLYFCKRLGHALLKLDSSQPSPVTLEKFKQLAPKTPRSQYRPIPIIHSLGPSTVSASDATASLLKFVELADESERNTPILWIGPTAAGHLELKGRKGNQDIWDFDRKVAAAAREKDVDVLGMWNLTVQASSWDGMRFSEKVAITQAMMVMNWLSRLESS